MRSRSSPNLRWRATALATLAALFFAACRGGDGADPVGPPLDPPDGSGLVQIDMRGRWEIIGLEILEQVGGVPTPPPPPTRLFPPLVGSKVEIGPLGFLDLDGMDTATLCMPGEFTERFAARNQQDGRFALCDFGCRSRPDPAIADGGSSRIQCAFGAISTDAMIGRIRIEVSAAPIPEWIPRSGLYGVTLVRR